MPDFSPYAPSISALDSHGNWLSISAIPDKAAGFGTPACRCCGSGCTRSWPATRMPNDADRLRHDPAFQLLADQPLGQPLSSQPTLSRWENMPSARELIGAHDGGLDAFV